MLGQSSARQSYCSIDSHNTLIYHPFLIPGWQLTLNKPYKAVSKWVCLLPLPSNRITPLWASVVQPCQAAKPQGDTLSLYVWDAGGNWKGKRECAALGWGRGYFIYSSLYWAVFWICSGKVLITKGCFHNGQTVLTQSRGLFCTWRGWRFGFGRGQSWGSLTPADPRDIPDHMAWCSA